MRFFLFLIITLLCTVCGNLPARADVPVSPVEVNGAYVQVPDWDRITLGNLDGAATGGSIGEDLIWQRGMTPADILRLGDIQDLGAETLSLTEIQPLTNLNIPAGDVSMAEFPLAGKQTIGRLAESVPNLQDFPLQDTGAVSDLAGSVLGDSFESLRNVPLGEVLNEIPDLGNLKLESLGDLSGYPISSIPNLQSTPIKSLSGWNEEIVSNVPFLDSVPLNSFPFSPFGGLAGAVMRIDFVWGSAEGSIDDTVSGSYKQGFNVKCREKCAHIELDDIENAGGSVQSDLEGKRWVSGKYQEVKGGSGCLSWVNGGYEPTGRHPFGDVFKMVVMEPDETTDTVSTALYFRIKTFCGASPYIIGPFPFMDFKRDGFIFLGPLESDNSSSGYSRSVSGVEKESLSASKSSDSATQSVAVGKEALCLSDRFIRGVDVNALRDSIAVSLGDVGYEYAGPYGCDVRGNCGRLLGRYLLPSTELDGVKGLDLSGELPQELFDSILPRKVQDDLVSRRLKALLEDTAREKNPNGDLFYDNSNALARRVAQKYLGGSSIAVESPLLKDLVTIAGNNFTVNKVSCNENKANAPGEQVSLMLLAVGMVAGGKLKFIKRLRRGLWAIVPFALGVVLALLLSHL